jgi:hypothetical protein
MVCADEGKTLCEHPGDYSLNEKHCQTIPPMVAETQQR